MSAIPKPLTAKLPLLENGDRLTQAEFHRRYEAYPEDVKFELIGGIVYMTSPLRGPHGRFHAILSYLLTGYALKTPGVEVLDNATTILGEESEPQPDLCLRILAAWGGRSRENDQGYIEGPPELVAEVAHSSVAIDMHRKRDDYRAAGVLEYLVLSLAEQELHWFHFKSRRLVAPDKQGIGRSRVFPGLWVDVPALLAGNGARLVEVVQQGLASPEHAAFAARLEKARRKRS
jgi:Uma2 family endonuclease